MFGFWVGEVLAVGLGLAFRASICRLDSRMSAEVGLFVYEEPQKAHKHKLLGGYWLISGDDYGLSKPYGFCLGAFLGSLVYLRTPWQRPGKQSRPNPRQKWCRQHNREDEALQAETAAIRFRG